MKIYIIGAGNMGAAMAKVLVKTRNTIYIADKHPQKLLGLKGIIIDKDFSRLALADVVFVAVKPQDIPALANNTRLLIKPSMIVISIAAGVPLAKIQKLFGCKKAVRVMPNLGLLVGQGIAAWKAAGLLQKEKAVVHNLLDEITENFEVKTESEIDSVTAISGSGSAYFFYLAQSLQEAARDFGFAETVARNLVEKTFSAAALLQSTPSRGTLEGPLPQGNPGGYNGLIAKIRSKKGTTDAALKVFHKHRLDKIIKLGVKAAKLRAQELSKQHN